MHSVAMLTFYRLMIFQFEKRDFALKCIFLCAYYASFFFLACSKRKRKIMRNSLCNF